MLFAWDPVKDAGNIEKHGIGFADAIRVFSDPAHLVKRSLRPEYNEERWVAIGAIDEVIYAVVYTDGSEETRRIISARRARDNERKRYRQSNDPVR